MACRIALLFATLLVSSALPGSALAQSLPVTGTVVDAQRGLVADAVLTLTGAGTTHTARTGADGTFQFPAVAPGSYTLQAEAPGFARLRETLQVEAGMPALALTLQVAGIVEDVSVTAGGPTTLQRPTLTGSRLGVTLLEVPASVQLVSGELIRERGDVSIADAKTRAVGVASQASPGNGGAGLSARGFSGVGSVMQLYDGAQFFIGSGTVSFPFDPWMVDRLEVLGGPGSVLYGTGAIGGVINVVPRKPTRDFDNSFRIGGGSQDSWRAALGSGGPLGARVSYRADVSYNTTDGWVDRGDSDSLAVSAAVRMDVSRTLQLTLSEDYGRQSPDIYFGSPIINGTVPPEYAEVNYNVTDANISYKDSWTQFGANWQPSPDVRVRASVHYLTTDRHWRNAENYAYSAATGLLTQSGFLEIFHDQRQIGQRSEALFNTRLFGLANSVAVGTDYNNIRFQHTNNGPFGGSRTLTLDTDDPGTFINLAGTSPRWLTHSNQASIFAEDRLVLGSRVSLVGGFRLDRQSVERLDLIAGTTSQRTFDPFTWRAGVVVDVGSGLAVYGQYATATDAIGNIISQSAAQHVLDLTTGRQVEAGVKQSFWNDRAQWTFAAYQIVKDNLLAPDPVNPGMSLQIGQQSSRGVEASATMGLGYGLRLDVNAAFLDARFDDFAENVGGVLTSRVGNTPPGTPERLANAWLLWNGAGGWQARGGVRYVGPRFLNNANTVTTQAYTVVDGGAGYQFGRASLDLRIYNLFDEFYPHNIYGGAAAPQWIVGRPRSVEVTLTTRF